MSNIIQMHSAIRGLLDNENSPKYLPKRVDEAIYSATNLIISDRYENEKKLRRERPYGFQSSSKLRDELSTLIKYSPWITVESGTDVILRTLALTYGGFPSDFNYLVSVIPYIDGAEYNAITTTYEEEQILQIDPKRRPTLIYPARVYYNEYADGLKIIWGSTGSLTKAKLVYIKIPVLVFYGNELVVNAVITQGTKIIPVKNSVIYSKLIASPNTEVDISLPEGIEYTVPTNASVTYQMRSGKIVKDFVNSDTPFALHDEIIRRAAGILAGTVENFNAKISINKEDLL